MVHRYYKVLFDSNRNGWGAATEAAKMELGHGHGLGPKWRNVISLKGRTMWSGDSDIAGKCDRERQADWTVRLSVVVSGKASAFG